MVKKINLLMATLFSIVLTIVETYLNWGDWQFAPLWMVDYLIVIVLLLGVFVCKQNQNKILLLGWSFSTGVMYMALFLPFDLGSALSLAQEDINILFAIGLALGISLIGVVLTMIDN